MRNEDTQEWMKSSTSGGGVEHINGVKKSRQKEWNVT